MTDRQATAPQDRERHGIPYHRLVVGIVEQLAGEVGIPLPAPVPGWALVEIRFGEDDGRRVLLVDGTVQSDVEGGGYWAAMVPDVRPRRALLLGLGAGTIARLIHARFGSVPIVGVDDDPSILDIARNELGDLPDLEIVVDDAFAYVARSHERFDLACVDLYRGAQPQARIVSRPFLRQLRTLLAPRGQAAFNLFADRRVETRIGRIGRVFRILQRIPVGKNVVIWCR